MLTFWGWQDPVNSAPQAKSSAPTLTFRMSHQNKKSEKQTCLKLWNPGALAMALWAPCWRELANPSSGTRESQVQVPLGNELLLPTYWLESPVDWRVTKFFSDVLVMAGLNTVARIQRLFWVVEVITPGVGHSSASGTRENRSHRHCPLVP